MQNQTVSEIDPKEINKAKSLISPHIRKTPIFCSEELNQQTNAEILFKCENFQKTGAFKFRGVMNALINLKKEHGTNISEIVAYSSGNHGAAIAYACRILGLKANILISKEISDLKKRIIKEQGVNLIETNNRQESEILSKEMASSGMHLIHHSDNDDVIAGAGTITSEIFSEYANLNAIFATCGGGGMLSGAVLAKKLHQNNCQLIGTEPELANDALRSFKSGKIYRFDKSPQTIAEGARTLSISERNFQYIKQLNDFIDVSEEQILHSCAWLMHLLKIAVEPTCAVAFAGALKWLKNSCKMEKPKICIIISGGNLDYLAYQAIWQQDRLKNPILSKF